MAAEPLQGENVQGLRSLDDGFIPPIIESSVDRKIVVSNRDAIVWTRGFSWRKAYSRAFPAVRSPPLPFRIAAELDEGNVVFVVADDG